MYKDYKLTNEKKIFNQTVKEREPISTTNH